MNRLAYPVSQSGNGTERVGPRTKVSDRSQILERVSLLLQRVLLGIGATDQLDARRVQFRGLTFRRRRANLALNDDTRSGRQFFDLRFVVRQFTGRNHLQIPEAASIIQFDEAKTAF